MMRGRFFFVDLTKDRSLMIDCLGPPKQARQASNIAREGEFSARHQTHRRAEIVDIGETARSGPEITRYKFVATFAGRDCTLWRLKSHIAALHFAPAQPQVSNAPQPINRILQQSCRIKDRKI